MVSAISSTNLPLAQAVEGRQPAPSRREAMHANTPGERTSAAQARAEQLRARQEGQASRERQALREAQIEETVQAAAGGSIEFEMQETTQVMKVLDSKDVLIYQVPPKGVLTLIKDQKDAAASQLLASA